LICRTCAHSVDNAAMICNYCGLNPLLGVDYCPKCSKKTTEREVLCFKCGSSLVKNGNLAEEYKISVAYKKLYRSEDEKYLFGLIAGISHKFKIPAIYVRVGFLILLLLSGYLFTVFAVSYLFSWYIPELPTKHKTR
jgi:phage shock protein PspC (stress-responsive transcriptional regulator)